MFVESRYKSQITRYRIECAKKMTGKVLDVGGGLGAYLPYFGSSDVTVLDINEEALKRLEHDKKVLGDACHMPFEDNTFDNIWVCSVCMYLSEDLGTFIEEAKRVLKKGKILIELPNPDSPWDKIKGILGMKVWASDKDIKHMYTAEELSHYGNVTGEVRFLPAFLDKMLRNNCKMWHTMMLEITIGEKYEKG